MPKKPAKVNYKDYLFHYAFCLGIVALLIISALNINLYFQKKQVLGVSIDLTPYLAEKTYWQKVTQENPTYIDGYLELAKVEKELDEVEEAKQNIQKAFKLNPNSLKIPEVQQQLGL